MQRMLTSREMAREMGVGVSSVKRWADEGRLDFAVTPGGHRRFFGTAAAPAAAAERGGHAAALQTLIALSDRLRQIGEQWACGEITVADEHRESHAIAESLDRMRRPNAEGPLCILACPPGELHELPLRMVRLVLEWRGWRTEFLGAATPWDSLGALARKIKPDLVALSARAPFLVPIDLGAPVVVGGSWARGPGKGVLRFRSVRAFDRWLASRD